VFIFEFHVSNDISSIITRRLSSHSLVRLYLFDSDQVLSGWFLQTVISRSAPLRVVTTMVLDVNGHS
jgi:hypothetical protein